MIVAIDGPAGTGKSTVAKRVAECLGYIFLDTGAMYRAVTYCLQQRGIPFDDSERVAAVLQGFSLSIRDDEGVKRYFLDEEEITEAIRSPEVNGQVSLVAALPAVRESLVAIQRRSVVGIDAVCEGRDMGTVVFPGAKHKFFLVARADIRAHRRYLELCAKSPPTTQTEAQVLINLMERDALDSTREVSPLRAADDATLIDTSDLAIDQVVTMIVDKVRDAS